MSCSPNNAITIYATIISFDLLFRQLHSVSLLNNGTEQIIDKFIINKSWSDYSPYFSPSLLRSIVYAMNIPIPKPRTKQLSYSLHLMRSIFIITQSYKVDFCLKAPLQLSILKRSGRIIALCSKIVIFISFLPILIQYFLEILPEILWSLVWDWR